MAINHADGLLVFSVPLYPIAACAAATHAGAGWFALLFAPVGLGIGLGICVAGRKMVYSMMGFGLSRTSTIQNRGIQTIAVLPFFILYMVLPIALVWGGLAAVWAGSGWVVRHLS